MDNNVSTISSEKNYISLFLLLLSISEHNHAKKEKIMKGTDVGIKILEILGQTEEKSRRRGERQRVGRERAAGKG